MKATIDLVALYLELGRGAAASAPCAPGGAEPGGIHFRRAIKEKNTGSPRAAGPWGGGRTLRG